MDYFFILLALIGGVGIFALIWLYFFMIMKILKNAPKDKPNVTILIVRIAATLPIVFFVLKIIFPIIFILDPMQTAFMFKMGAVLGSYALFSLLIYKMIDRFFYRPRGYVIPNYWEYSSSFEKLYHKQPSVQKYIKHITLDKFYKAVEEIFSKKIPFYTPEKIAINLDKGVKVLSSVETFYDRKHAKNVDIEFSIPYGELKKHVYILAPSGSGKTKSVIGPILEQIVDKGMGLILLDPKGDNEVLESTISLFKEQNRTDQLMFFDIAYPYHSSTYNPLATNPPKQAVNLVISILDREKQNEFYFGQQAEVIRTIFDLLDIYMISRNEKRLKINFIDLYAILIYLPSSIEYIINHIDREKLLKRVPNGLDALNRAESLLERIKKEKSKYFTYLSGLNEKISRYAFLGSSPWMLNDYNPDIDLSTALDGGKVLTFFLRAMQSPEYAYDIAKMILTDIRLYAANLQSQNKKKDVPDIVIVDEAARVLPNEFDMAFEMARSAGLALVLAHQSKSQLPPERFDNLMTNTSTKVLLGAGDIMTAKQFSDLVGEETKFTYTYGTSGVNIFSSLKDWLLPHWSQMAREDRVKKIPPERFVDMPIGEGFIFTRLPDRGIVASFGKTYFFAKEYSKLKVSDIMQDNKSKTHSWRNGGLNLMDTFIEMGENPHMAGKADEKNLDEYKKMMDSYKKLPPKNETNAPPFVSTLSNDYKEIDKNDNSYPISDEIENSGDDRKIEDVQNMVLSDGDTLDIDMYSGSQD